MCVCIYFRSKAQSNFIRKFKFELWSTLELPVYKEVSETSAEHLHLWNITYYLYFNPYACVRRQTSSLRSFWAREANVHLSSLSPLGKVTQCGVKDLSAPLEPAWPCYSNGRSGCEPVTVYFLLQGTVDVARFVAAAAIGTDQPLIVWSTYISMKTLSWFLQFFYVPFTAQIRPVRRTAAPGFQGECTSPHACFDGGWKQGRKHKGLPKRSIYYCRGRWEIAAASDKSPFRCIQRPVPFRSVNFTESDRWFSPGW